MSRIIKAAAAQMGPVQRSQDKTEVVATIDCLLNDAADKGCDLVVLPELALTTFFPRWLVEDEAELDAYYETAMPGDVTRPLFETARRRQVSFYLGYAELIVEAGRKRRFNTSIIVDRNGDVIAKYRKIHLPGHAEPDPRRQFHQFEKRYFEVGDLGFPVWDHLDGRFGMCLCNDRRWPETFRVMGLQGVEMVLLGYNTPTKNSIRYENEELRRFHNRLCMQAAAYQNSTFVIGAAKAGVEDGHGLIGGSAIVHPDGRVIAEAKTDGDELVIAECDLDDCVFNRETIFNFSAHRRTEHYALITDHGATPTKETMT